MLTNDSFDNRLPELNHQALDTHSLFLNPLCAAEIIKAWQIGPDLLPGSELEPPMMKPPLTQPELLQAWGQHVALVQQIEKVQAKPTGFETVLLPPSLLFHANQTLINLACQLLISVWSSEFKGCSSGAQEESSELLESSEMVVEQIAPQQLNVPNQRNANPPGGDGGDDEDKLRIKLEFWGYKDAKLDLLVYLFLKRIPTLTPANVDFIRRLGVNWLPQLSKFMLPPLKPIILVDFP